MIEGYFSRIEYLIQNFPDISNYTIRKTVYNNKQGCINGSIQFKNGYCLEFVEVKQTDKEAKIKYRYHFMDPEQNLVFRYDNANHFPNINTFPHHKHFSAGVKDCKEPTMENILLEIAAMNADDLP